MRDGIPDGLLYARYAKVDGIESFEYQGPAKHLARHAHAEYQLTLYQGTPHRFQVAGRDVAGSRHGAVILQADEPHSSQPASEAPLVVRGLYIERRVMNEAAASIWRARTSVVFAQPLLEDRALVTRLVRAHVALAGGEPDAEILFRAALVELVRQCATPTGPERLLVSAVTKVERARELLLDRLAETVSLQELADAAGVSRYHLIRLFTARYGFTPLAYQRNERVRRAREVLAHGGAISAAVAAGGFADQSHLGRAFVAVMGVTPGRYRIEDPAQRKQRSAGRRRALPAGCRSPC